MVECGTFRIGVVCRGDCSGVVVGVEIFFYFLFFLNS